jgi:hypothetical protein
VNPERIELNRREKLGWVPTPTVEELCREMVESDLRLMRNMGDLESLVLRATNQARELVDLMYKHVSCESRVPTALTGICTSSCNGRVR